MKNRRFLALSLTAFCILTGLLLPFLTTALQDAKLDQSHWPIPDDSIHYAYQGTLLNRVLALNAHLNGSPAVFESKRTEANLPNDLWSGLSTFLPLPDAADGRAEAFLLEPRQYSAEYRYIEVTYSGESFSLAVTVDSENALPLRVELDASPDAVAAYLEAHSLWDILKSYAALLNLGMLSDDVIVHNSTLLQTQTSEIRGMPLTLTATAVPSSGIILLKLTGSTSD